VSPAYLRQTSEGVVIHVRAQPNAKRSEVVGLHGEELKIRLHAPPVEGKANEALVDFLSNLFRVAPSTVEIIRGETSRSKQVLMRGRTIEQLNRALQVILPH
jgi:hypothetical protein